MSKVLSYLGDRTPKPPKGVEHSDAIGTSLEMDVGVVCP